MGRPRKEIDAEQVYKLAQLGCSYREIAGKFGVDEKTVRNNYSAQKELGESGGNIAIRRWQMRRAKAGSDAMLTLLGKARLGQTERVDITSGNKPIAYVERAKNPRDGHLVSSNGNGHTNGIPPQSPPETVGSD